MSDGRKLIGYDKAYGKDLFSILSYPDNKVTLVSYSQDSLDKFKERMTKAYRYAAKMNSYLIDVCYGPYKKEQYHKQKMMQALHRGDISHIEYNRLRMKSKSFIQKLREDTI